jgi:hypothetical protein
VNDDSNDKENNEGVTTKKIPLLEKLSQIIL